METTTYTVDGKEFELKHYGVKGMKWGRRKARPQAVGRTPGGKQSTETDEAAVKEARRRKVKRAAMIGAAVVATALTAYGAKKMSDVVKDKAYKSALERGTKATRDLITRKINTDFAAAVYSKDSRKIREADERISQLNRYLTKKDLQYAERASRNTVAAIKELMGKNYELPLATLKKMGIKTIDI